MKTIMKYVNHRCIECGLELSGGGPSGLCPRCLLQTALPDATPNFDEPTQIDVLVSSRSTLSDPGDESERTETSATSATGKRFFGDYELLEEIASGGMGTVFRARQTRLNRVVALKMIRAVQSASTTEIERFYAEAEAAAHLDHPGIISVYEIGEQDGQHYFSMALIDHGNLTDWIRERHTGERRAGLGRSDQETCVRILKDVASAVHFAHQRQILHRDLKPSNILLHEDGQPCVTDFGLAQRTTADSRLTASGTLIGTPSYMAPEQATGDRSAMTISTDIYGLGAVLYEMLTGQPPFVGESPIDTVLKVVNSEPIKPSALCAVDRDLETICLKCLEKDPARRYGSSDALADELERWLQHEPIQARRASLPERFSKWIHRRPIVASLVGLLLLVIIAAFAAVTWQWNQTKVALAQARENAVAEATAHSAVLTPQHRLSHHGPVISSVFSADGSRVLTASHDRTAIIWNSGTGQRIAALKGHSGVLSAAKFSPDGNMILTVSDDGTSHYTFLDPAGRTVTSLHTAEPGDKTVRVWDANTGAELAVLTGHTAAVTDASFSPDGSQIVSCSYDRSARIWDIPSGREVVKLEGHQAAVLAAVFSPDGRHVLTSSCGTDFEVRTHEGGSVTSGSHTVNEPHVAIVWNAETGARLFGLKNYGNSSRVRAVYSPDGQWIATAAEEQRNVALWNAADGSYVTGLTGHTHEVNAVRFSLDGRRLVTASSDATARVYEVPTGRHIATMKGHDETVLSADFSADSRRVVTASGDGNARVWDAASGTGLAVLQGHEDRVNAAVFSPDGILVATASLDGTAAIWRSATMEQLAVVLDGHTGDVTSIRFSPDGRHVLTASRDGSAIIWDAASGESLAVLTGHASLQDTNLRDRLLRDCRTAQFSPDGSLVVTATEETHGTIKPFFSGQSQKLPFNPVRIFDTQSGTEPTVFSGLVCGAQFAAFSPNGRMVATTPDAKTRFYTQSLTGMSSSSKSRRDTMPRLFDVRNGQEICSLPTHSGVVSMAAFHPNSQQLVTVDERHIRLFDLPSGKLVASTSEDLGRQQQIEYSPDGRLILCRGWGRTACLLNAADLTVVRELNGHQEMLTDACFSPNGEFIATASTDATARLWETETGQMRHILDGHRKEVSFVAFDPAGENLVTSSQDRRVRLWDVISGRLRGSLEGHKGQVTDASFSPDGRWLGTASDDYTARIWPVYLMTSEKTP